MYTNINVLVAIAMAGIAGCLMTAFFANSINGIPVSAIAGNWKKHIWSIIFAIPIPMLLGMNQFGVVIAFLWLILAPTIASKVYFGPKEVPAMVLNAFHSGYAIAALLVYVFVSRYILLLV